MKCITASRINQNKLTPAERKVVREFGAKALAAVTSVNFDPKRIGLEPKRVRSSKDFITKYKDTLSVEKMYMNMIFTGSEFSLNNLNSLDNLTKSFVGSKLPFKIPAYGSGIPTISKIFAASGFQLNENPQNREPQVLVHSGMASELSEITESRVFKITGQQIQDLTRYDHHASGAHLSYMVASALARGFDVMVVSDGVAISNMQAIQEGVKFFNNNLKGNYTALLSSNLQTDVKSGIRKYVNIDTFLKPLSTPEAIYKNPKVLDSNPLLNEFLSEDDRKLLDKQRNVHNAEKLQLGRALMKSFKKVVPGIEYEMINSYEIRTRFGNNFANKKGFIMNGKIIINLDTFTGDTMFHEFSHFFFKWLRSENTEIYNKLMSQAKQFPQYKNIVSAYNRTGMTLTEDEKAEEVFAVTIGLNANKQFNKLIKENGSMDMFEEKIDDFMMDFTNKLVGKSMKATTLNIYSTVSDIFSYQYENMNPNTEHDFYQSEFMHSLRNFAYGKVTFDEGYRMMFGKNLFRLTSVQGSPDTFELHLFDVFGNAMNTDGDPHPDNFAGRIYRNPKPGSVEEANNKAVKKSLEKFVNKMIASVDVKFDATITFKQVQSKVVNDIRMSSQGLRLNADDTKYVDDAGNEYDRTTGYIDEKFSDPVAEDHYIRVKMISEFKEEAYKKHNKKGLTDVAEIARIDKEVNDEVALRMNHPDGELYQKKYAEIATLFKLKQEEGTFLHEVAELFVRTLNYTEKIDYNTKYEKTKTYFMDQIINAISNKDRASFELYYKKFFFDVIPDTDSQEFKEFKKNYDIVNKKMSTDDTTRVGIFLLKLQTKFNSDIFNSLDGPVELLPEIRVANKEMGTAGTIDLLVVDKKGVAHIFDYKTKEVGKERNWNFQSELRLTNEFAGYRSNAKMKASLQTSLYKVMLQQLGIQTAAAKVFYVAGVLDDTSFNSTDAKNLRYKISEIKTEPLSEVSSELYEHFSKKLKSTPSTISHDISEVISKASGGENIDIPASMIRVVDDIYRNAIERSSGRAGSDLSMFGVTGHADGLVIYINGNIKHIVPKKIKGEAKIKAYIKEILEKNVAAKAKVVELENLFQDPNMEIKSSSNKTVYSALLAGASENTHELVKMSSIMDLGSDFSGVAMLKDRVTKQHRIIVLNHDKERSFKFSDGDLKRKHLFGNYITEAAAKNLIPNKLPKNNNHNMRLVKTGLMMMRMKQMDPTFTVSHIVSNTADTLANGRPGFIDVDTILQMTINMVEVMIKSGEDVPQTIKDLISNSELRKPRAYLVNPLDALAEYVDNVLESGKSSSDEINKLLLGKTGKPRVDKLKEELEKYDPRTSHDKLFGAMHEILHTLGQRLQTDEERVNNKLWELIDNSIMFLFDFNYNIMPSNPSTLEKNIGASSMSSNAYQVTLNSRINNSKTAISKEYMEFKTEFNKKLENLAAVHGKTLGNVKLELSMKSIFKNLFKTDNTNRNTAYILKSPDEVTHQAEKDMLIFMKETFQNFADETVPSAKTIPYGWMPLMKRSKLSYQSTNTDPVDFIKTLLLGTGNSITQRSTDSSENVSTAFSTNNRFGDQMPNEEDSKKFGEQYNFTRRLKLSIDQYGLETSTASINPLNMIEDNLENVLDAFVMASLETKHFKDVTAFGRAMLFNTKRIEKDSNSNFSNLVDTLGIIQKKIINHETSETKGPIMSGVNKFATGVVVAGRVHQVLLEMFTNPMVTASLFFSDLLYGKMFKGQRKFSSASFATAMRYVVDRGNKREVIKKIDMLFGMTNSDNTHVKEMLNQLEGKGLFQSDNLMYLNKLFLDTWQQVAMAAYMIEEGSFEAYSIDEYGNLKYDEDQDKRFFTGKYPRSKEQHLGKQTYDAIKSKIAKERGGLTGLDTENFDDRKLNWGLAPTERTGLKNLITQTYSSMDEESKGLIMYYTAMNLFNKMRSWIFPKFPRYFAGHKTAEQNTALAKLVKIPDASEPSGYRVEWKASPSEGIALTGQHILRSAMDLKLDIFKKDKGIKLEDYQVENLSKLMGDMFTWSFLMLAGIGLFKGMLDDEDRKNPTLQLLYKRYVAATGDVFLAYSLLDITSGQGSIFIGVSIALNAMKALKDVTLTAAAMSYSDDVTTSDLLTALNKLGKSSHGLYATGAAAYDAIEFSK
ncbi:MAG: PD-(D/E)XK nuclease family protein [Chlamydiia bacterium]|nr:PD-(D/E)XK nuclease family protein [Chlamydiia bacterium]